MRTEFCWYVLSFLTTQGLGQKDQERLGLFLDRLTEQQLLLQGSPSESPFYFLELPLQHEGRIYNQRLAIKAPRKGNKIDWNHCRIALQAQTPTLGELAIDGWLYEGQLSLKVFCHDPKEIAPLIEENTTLIREQFHRWGLLMRDSYPER